MNRKGFELAISTLILIVLGIVVLIAIIYALNGGFSRFNKNIDTLLAGPEGAAVKKSCEIACSVEDRLTYCCKDFEIGSFEVQCGDKGIVGSCALSCENYECPEISK